MASAVGPKGRPSVDTQSEGVSRASGPGLDPLLPFRMGLYERARSARNRSSAEGVGCARIWRQYYRQAPEKRMVSSPKRRNKPYRYACGRAL